MQVIRKRKTEIESNSSIGTRPVECDPMIYRRHWETMFTSACIELMTQGRGLERDVTAGDGIENEKISVDVNVTEKR